MKLLRWILVLVLLLGVGRGVVGKTLFLHMNQNKAVTIRLLYTASQDAERFSGFIKKLKSLPDEQQAEFLVDVARQNVPGIPAGAHLSENMASLDAGLVDAWVIASKHTDLRTNASALSKLNDIAGRNRGIDKVKLKAALDGDLGDVLSKATGDDLTNILNKLDEPHVTDAHLDEITSRLGNAEYGIKQDLIDHPDWFSTFDDILTDPGIYWEKISQGEIINGSALQAWAQGKWWKDIRETAKTFQNTAGLNKVKSVFGDIYGSQITLRITKTGEQPVEIVADYLAKDANDVFYIIDTKYTTLDNFDLTKSLTPNQSKVFPWIKNGDNILIEVRAVNSKLEDLNLFQGDMLDPNNLKIDIYKSVPGNCSEVAPIINYK